MSVCVEGEEGTFGSGHRQRANLRDRGTDSSWKTNVGHNQIETGGVVTECGRSECAQQFDSCMRRVFEHAHAHGVEHYIQHCKVC